jgi:peptidoglycan/xylan/chitin deacetylase (PgdA/CDA1 family)
MRVCALLYHDVVPEGRFELSGFQSPDADIYKLSTAEFARHLDALASTTTVVSVASALNEPDPPERPILLTFDDGGASALPVADQLETLGWRGHFFVTTDFIGTRGFLDAPAIRELRRRGHVIGSHSASHPARMSACTTDHLEREWSDSIHRLSDLLGEAVSVASVPGGFYSHGVGAAAAKAGVRVLFNSEPVMRVHRVGDCLIVGRFGVQQGVPAAWAASVVRGEIAPRAMRYLHWNGKKLLKRIGGERWLAMRRHLIAVRARR